MIDIAYQTITWRDNVRAALSDIAKAGFKAFETFSFPPIESDTWPGYVARLTHAYRNHKQTYLETDAYKSPRDLLQLMEEYNLKMASMYCSGLFIDSELVDHEQEAIINAMFFIQEIGCRHLILGGGMNLDGVYTARDYDRFYETLHAIGKQCKDEGILACYHPHSGTMVETGDQLDSFCRETDASLISLAPDIAHLVRGKVDPIETIYKYAERIAYIHLKDIKGNEFYELGLGEIDLPAVIQALRDIDYTGWAVIELDDTTHTPLESAIISRRYIREELSLPL
jgi:inosose dehydratase